MAVWRDLESNVDPGSTPRYVSGDAGRVDTVVSNLIAHAVKNTPYRFITVTAHVFDELDGPRAEGHVVVEIVISDTGCGIPPEKPGSIFREFGQVDPSAHHRPGTRPGLGV